MKSVMIGSGIDEFSQKMKADWCYLQETGWSCTESEAQ